MIWSVSTLLRRRGTPTPVWLVKLSMSGSLRPVVVSTPLGRRGLADRRGFADRRVQVGRRAEGAADRGGGRDRHRDQMGASALALTALEVAVGRRRAALLRCELVGVHPEAHRASGTAPLSTG